MAGLMHGAGRAGKPRNAAALRNIRVELCRAVAYCRGRRRKGAVMSDVEQGYHYNVMRRAIESIDAGGEAKSLEALAAEMGMSPAHFQRLFTRWAGVSPKRFQQYLTLGHAKVLLRDHFTTLETSNAVGLLRPDHPGGGAAAPGTKDTRRMPWSARGRPMAATPNLV